MIRGLYTAYTGMLNQQHRLDTISNNLANAATTAFKREGATAKSFDEVMAVKANDLSDANRLRKLGQMSLGVKVGENYTDYSQGSFRATNNPYDLAIEGNGFFSISFTSKSGEQSVKYTRDGEFTVDAEGMLRTKDGDYVLGEGGEIAIPTDAGQVAINKQGQVYADGVLIDTLAIVDFEDYNYLKKYGENMYEEVEGAIPKDVDFNVHQGHLEASNVNVIKEMVEMITISRAFESNQKMMQTVDQSLSKSVNTVGNIKA